jgi:polysaccharide chain length determinant protein (PEP-CTERM system associated)
MLWKQRWIAIGVCVCSAAVSIVIAKRLPAVYRAEVLVFVDAQKIPDRFVSSTVDEDLSDSLALISQEIMSRTRLVKIVDMFHLYPRERARKTEEEIVEQMRRDITLKVEHGGKLGAFRLGYQGDDPNVVAAVTNQLAGLYVAENLKSRENQAQGTVDFLHAQLEEAKRNLDEQEAKVSQFKQRNNGILPQQENSLLSTLSNMRVQLQGCQDAINRGEADKAMLETALSSAETFQSTLEQSLRPRARSRAAGFDSVGTRPKLDSEVLQERLDNLKTRYTADHPEVQDLEERIRRAKRDEQRELADSVRVAGSMKSASDHADDGPVIATPDLLRERERVSTLRVRLSTVNREIEAQKQVRDRIVSEIQQYEERINRLPLVEQQMAAVTRDYENSKANYKSLLDKELAAGIATDMERSQKSERFTIMDAAKVPEKPFKPKRLAIAAAGSLGGLIVGFLAGFLLEWRKRTLLGEWELPFDVVVLGRVPVIRLEPVTASSGTTSGAL